MPIGALDPCPYNYKYSRSLAVAKSGFFFTFMAFTQITMNEEDDGADTARNQIGNLPCFDYAQVTHTLWHTRIVTGVHIHIRSILSIALLGHTHTHTRSRRELRFGAGLETCNLYFVFLSFFSFCIRSAN